MPTPHIDSFAKNGVRCADSYVLRFDKEPLPPVDAFWSVTISCSPDGFLVANPIDRYPIGDQPRGPRYGNDSSMEVYIQHQSPDRD